MIYFISVKPDYCNGCKVCEITCSLQKEGECNPEKARLQIYRKEEDGLVSAVPIVCQQCLDPPCQKACPNEAITKSDGSAYLLIDAEKCNSCGECVRACPIRAIRLGPEGEGAMVCDLCQLDPPCVKLCHSGALGFTTLEREPDEPNYQYLYNILQEENLLASFQ